MATCFHQTRPLGEEAVGVFEGASENLLDQSALFLPTSDSRAAPAPVLPPWVGQPPLFPSLCSPGWN